MSKELLMEYSNMLFLKAIKRAKKKPSTSLEKHLKKIHPSLLEVLTKQAEFIVNSIIQPLLNSYNISVEYIGFLNKYYFASKALIFTLISSYIEMGEALEPRKLIVDITKSYPAFMSDIKKLREILTGEELDILSFVYLVSCEYNLGLADKLSLTETDVFDFLKRAELQQLAAYANALDCVLTSALMVSTRDIEINDRVKENLKWLLKQALTWADEVFNMCIHTGISRGGNVLKALPEVKEKVLREIGESLKWLALKLSP
nr:hypothetical protein [Candidatus Freyarchaeota archaeon]